ncbi:hybrid sensor histidine kinase/response regulator [Leptolyngbya sp. 'hensonii']|uniref:hybrid sensor histidine kinase/response regulator n=1 Tax=Leptolyngbya sp. 'hensonii' TaxID=1922337 RepID=UPI00094FA16D|nr:hybrid sensor histidine kinase/response regulator [Leptolyngbya sp. 'hensonii']OLP18038.1 hybrid sensor histidine kinase/response regulator [Leptolyngbya sp. 'hensonii']
MDGLQPDPGKGDVLIVDDTPNNLHLLSSMLEELGYEVRCASSGAMALMAVSTEYPDLILLDISMPDMNGYEVCQHLKENQATQEIPVIFLSALSETIDKVKAFQLGGVDYITKPFQIEEVLARIENQLALRRMQIKLQQAEAEALRALEQEKELNRLKSEFVSMVSHDFRSPLTTIQGFAELLRCSGQVPDLETVNHYVDKIDVAVEHLLCLLDEILLLGSIEAGKLQYQPMTIDLKSFCQELIETLQVSTNSSHQICFTCTGNSTQAEMDTLLLQQIFTNLLSNAIKYSPTAGQINLNLECSEMLAIVQIRDQGIGIPLENQPHLFDAFYRCHNVGQIKGTGLGLAVVKRCVEAHQGYITVESQEGMGTTFTVTLPRYAQLSDHSLA